jgi:hypothetical protein
MKISPFNAVGEQVNNFGDYPEAVRQVAKEKNVALIDFHTMSRLFYTALEAQGKDVSNPPNSRRNEAQTPLFVRPSNGKQSLLSSAAPFQSFAYGFLD